MSHFYIAAAHKSSGKTTLSIGLVAAFKSMGKNVQTFKKGPDYIDPIWLQKASENPCFNLDFNTQSDAEIKQLFTTRDSMAEISVIEGNKGLYDGVDLQGADCNAAMAKLLSSPIILTIDTRGTTRGIAPLLLGYETFDKDVNIAGVILNKVAGSRHEKKLLAAVEHYTDIPVVGAIGYNQSLEIPERHLGLIPANESHIADKVIKQLTGAVTQGVNLKHILDIASNENKSTMINPQIYANKPAHLKIAIAKDEAFGFYYADDLEAFTAQGAELIPFDALSDPQLPDVDGLFIGGGFPETQMEKLSSNQSLMADIKNKIVKGLPAYAECGGLMYLSNSILWSDKCLPMVGVIPGDIHMHKRPQGRGYVKLKKSDCILWQDEQNKITDKYIPAHEFHYASLENLPDTSKYAFKVLRGSGITAHQDGIQINNLLAGFSHLRNTDANPWVAEFVKFVRSCAGK